MDHPPAGHHGADRFDYVELDGPPDAPLPPWLTADWMPCGDCRANAFLKWRDGRWEVTIAHDETCPALRTIESAG
jgi:hypothetical protein